MRETKQNRLTKLQAEGVSRSKLAQRILTIRDSFSGSGKRSRAAVTTMTEENERSLLSSIKTETD